MSRARRGGSAIILIALLAGCDAKDEGSAGGPVELSAFCAAYEARYCEASTLCCAGDAVLYESVDDCMAASPCPIDADDPRFGTGEWVYDATAAGAFLAAMPTAADRCEAHQHRLDFLQGPPPAAKAIGEACDVEADTCRDGYCAEGTCRALAVVGAACADDEACVSELCQHPSDDEGTSCADGRCTCASAISGLYCADALDPPANGNPDWSDINEFKVCAGTGNSAGTDDDIDLTYYWQGRYWTCTFDGLDSGECATCAIFKDPDGTAGHPQDDYGRYDFSSGDFASKAWIEVGMDGTNGFKFGRVEVTDRDDKTRSANQFTNDDPNKLRCNGCGVTNDACDKCWLDSNGYGKCVRALINIQGSGSVRIRCLEGD